MGKLIEFILMLIIRLWNVIKNALFSAFQHLLWQSMPKARGAVRTGQDYEKYIADYLAWQGYHHIVHTGRTGDFGVDIVARKGLYTYAIQCKYYKKPVDGSAVQQVVAGMPCYGCNAAMVVTNQTLTANALTLAQKNHVEVRTGVVPIERVEQVSLEAWMTPSRLVMLAVGGTVSLLLLNALKEEQMLPNWFGCLVLAGLCFAGCSFALGLVKELVRELLPQRK